MLPLLGVSGIDMENQPFYGPAEDQVLFDTLRGAIDKNVVDLEEFDLHINDKLFAETAAQKLIDLMK